MRHLDRLAVMIVVLVAIFATSTYAQSNRIRLDLNIRGRHGSSHLGYDVGRSGNSSHFGVRYSGPSASFSYSTSRYESDFDRFLRQREIDRLLMERRQMFGSKNYGCLPTIDHLYNSPSVGYGGNYGGGGYSQTATGPITWVPDANGNMVAIRLADLQRAAAGDYQPQPIPSLSLPSPNDLQPMPSGIAGEAYVEVVNEFDCDVYVEFCDPFPGGQTRESFRVTRNSTKRVDVASGRYAVVIYGYAPDKRHMGQKLYEVSPGNNLLSSRYLAN